MIDTLDYGKMTLVQEEPPIVEIHNKTVTYRFSGVSIASLIGYVESFQKMSQSPNVNIPNYGITLTTTEFGQYLKMEYAADSDHVALYITKRKNMLMPDIAKVFITMDELKGDY